MNSKQVNPQMNSKQVPDVKVGTPEEGVWNSVKLNLEKQILAMKVEHELAENNLTLVIKKLQGFK